MADKSSFRKSLFLLFEEEGRVTFERAFDVLHTQGLTLKDGTFYAYRNEYFIQGERLSPTQLVKDPPLTLAEEKHVAQIIKAESIPDNADFNWQDHARMMKFAVAVEAVGGIAKARQLLDDLERFVITLRG